MKTVKIIVLFVFISGFNTLYAQEFNAGAGIGTGLGDYLNVLTYNLNFEYKPAKLDVSLNFDPVIINGNSNSILTTPFYIKAIVGNKLKICPLVGGFVRFIDGDNNYGWLAGLGLELPLGHFQPYIKAEYDMDYWKSEHPLHFGGVIEEQQKSPSAWLSLGLKYRLL